MPNIKTSFLSEYELTQLGLKTYGKDVRISRYARFYHPERIIIGDHVRIDDFCIISAGSSITIGNYIHIACYTSIIGEGSITIEDYCSISGRVSIYSSTDDYLGMAMTNPMVPAEYTKVTSLPVILHKNVIIGCGCVILPGVKLFEGASIGALSLINKDCLSDTLYSGNPAKPVAKRLKQYRKLESRFEDSLKNKQNEEI